ncbi:cytochrome b5-like isoform X1 [Crassostrea virginica]
MSLFPSTVPNPMAAATVIKPTTVHLPNSPSISPRIPEFSRAEVAEHCEIHSCWIIVSDKVYDVTQFIQEHPGGLDVIMEYAGRDATVAFMDKGHSKDAWMLLTDFFIGDMVKEDRIMK